MAWELVRPDDFKDEKHCFASRDVRVSVSDSSKPDFRPANFNDIISNELILICVASYLPVPSLLALSSSSKAIRLAMHKTPSVWRIIDLSDLRSSSLDVFLVKFLRQPYVLRDCRVIVLDGLAFDHDLLDGILLRELPLLRCISLSRC